MECLRSNDSRACSVCKRLSKTFMARSAGLLSEENSKTILKRLWKSVNPGFTSHNVGSCDIIRLVADSLVESLSYQATYLTSSFLKNKLQVYYDMVHCLVSYLSYLDSEERRDVEESLRNELKTSEKEDVLREVVYTIIIQLANSSAAQVTKLFEVEKTKRQGEDLIDLLTQ